MEDLVFTRKGLTITRYDGKATISIVSNLVFMKGPNTSKLVNVLLEML